MNLILKALRFAENKHKGQTRKVTGEEYFVHPLMVSYIVANYKMSQNLEILIVAAILHDTVEDTDTTFEEILKEFGMFVATLVFELTDDKAKKRKLGNLEYCKLRWCGLSNYALYLKLCDRLYNMSDHPTKEQQDTTLLILDHVESKRKLTLSQQRVVFEIRKVING
jgi:guanosine-3',5'-bis(diphosphate) 3'-pyrophosphohydrolase